MGPFVDASRVGGCHQFSNERSEEFVRISVGIVGWGIPEFDVDRSCRGCSSIRDDDHENGLLVDYDNPVIIDAEMVDFCCSSCPLTGILRDRERYAPSANRPHGEMHDEGAGSIL